MTRFVSLTGESYAVPLALAGAVRTTTSTIMRRLSCGYRMPSAGAGIREGTGEPGSLRWISRLCRWLDDAQNPARPPSGRLPGLLHRATALSSSRIGYRVEKCQCFSRAGVDQPLTSTPCPGRAVLRCCFTWRHQSPAGDGSRHDDAARPRRHVGPFRPGTRADAGADLPRRYSSSSSASTSSSESGSSSGSRHTSSQRWTLVAMSRALGRSTVRTQ